MKDLPPLAGWPMQTSFVQMQKKQHKKRRPLQQRSKHLKRK